MKIVQVLPGKIWGGAEQYVLDLGKTLITLGHEVRFIALKKQPIINRLRAENIKCEYISKISLFSFEARQVFKKNFECADIVHFHDINQVSIMNWAKKCTSNNVKLIATRHIARASKLVFWKQNALNNIDDIIFVSSLSKELWTKANSTFPLSKTTIIINSVAPILQNNDKCLRDIYNIPVSCPILVFAGRIRKSKGCEIILKALSLLREFDFKMVFIGTPKPKNYIKKLKNISNKLGIEDRIIFHGFSNNVNNIISNTSIGLAPSIVREACPLSPLEFMQLGIPIITSNNGAQKEYVEDGVSGYLVKPGDVENLSNKIKILLEDQKLRQRIGLQAKSYFDNYLSFETFINNILNVYRK